MNDEIADIRKDYKLKSLLEADVAKDPIDQFSIGGKRLLIVR